MSDQVSFEYNGYEIQQDQHHGTFSKVESMGFTVNTVFKVADEFGDYALPLNHQLFWSPSDAAQAIDCALYMQKKIGNLKKWPTTAAHEFNIMLCYRRKFWRVYEAIDRIKGMCIDARDFDENPREKIIDILNVLHQHVVAE